METLKLKDMVRGWFIGNFEPSILKTKDFEVGVLSHKKDEIWPAHYHKEATEYNVLLSGKMQIDSIYLTSGDIFIFKPGEVARPKFLEDCTVLCIKIPSILGDKYEVLC